MIPHFQKRHKGGEDAACVQPQMLAVADGVGGWAESGVDPAIFSKKLCSLIDTNFALPDRQDFYLASPKQLLVDSVNENRETGSSTCVIVTLDPEAPVIQTVNMGDSGYVIIKLNEEREGG
mmetsp:Transcript_7050/g.11868  ORF Transcript_7050/g.11868 Transcript_7050/m.11868 type:complete len:121 (+) Transcript_7050:262-624(+)